MKFTLTIVCREDIKTWSQLRSALIATTNAMKSDGNLQGSFGNALARKGGEPLLRVGSWELTYDEDAK